MEDNQAYAEKAIFGTQFSNYKKDIG